LPSYTFGPFRLDSEATTLFRSGEPVALGPRAVGLLRALVERHGVPVSKDTLMETAWAGSPSRRVTFRSKLPRCAGC
jgi:DNA-binding winged helix-turn-helix (wHTH) protein